MACRLSHQPCTILRQQQVQNALSPQIVCGLSKPLREVTILRVSPASQPPSSHGLRQFPQCLPFLPSVFLDKVRRRARSPQWNLVDIDQLQAFLAIVDHGSVLAAADALKLPRSTIRSKVATLEAEIGLPLFTRTRDGAVVTGAGQALTDRARAVVTQVRQLAASVREEEQFPKGELHIRAPLGLPPELMALVIGEFRARHPRVSLRLSFAEEPTVHQPTDVDLMLHFGPTVPRGPFRTHVVLKMREMLLASPGYVATNGMPQTVADLAQHPLLLWRAPGESGRHLTAMDGRLVPVTPALVSSDIHQLRMLVNADAGIGLLPNPGVRVTVAPVDALPVLADQIGREVALRLVIPEVHATLPGTRAAVQLIREMAEGVFGFRDETLST